MSTIVTRLGKGSPLTYAEGDANFTNLNTDKVENTTFNAHLASTSAHPAADIPIVDTANHYVATDVEGALAEAYTGIRAYADSLVVGLLDDRGNYDASTNLFPSTGGSGTAGAILKGDLWYVTVAGTLGGVFIAAGDTIRALVDSPGQIATNWASMEKGGLTLTYFLEGRNTTTPNATVPVHSFTATGAETNIDVALSPKGTGALTAQVADNTTAGGNKRGANSVDFQTYRVFSSSVASGSYSFIGSGQDNTSSGANSFCGAGSSNSAVGSGAFNGAGSTNSVSGQAAFNGAGLSNIASGQNSSTFGAKATTRGIYCKVAYGSGSPSTSSGAAQIGLLPLRALTADATATVLTSDNLTPSATNVEVLPDSHTYMAIAYISARNASTGDSASWKIEGLVKRGIGVATTALVGVPAITTIAKDTGASAWSVAMVADTTLGAVEVQVTGVAATTIHWVCKLDTVEVG